MITYPEIRAVKQGCGISYWGILLVGVIACFLSVSTAVRGFISRVLFILFATDLEGPCR